MSPQATVPTSSRAAARPGAVLAVIVAAQLMIGLDSSIVTIALPAVGADLGLGLVGLSWVQNAYTLAFAGLLLLGGRLGDLLGRRRTLVAGVIVFTAASLLGGLAPNGAALIAARALQGVAAAVIAPSTLALLTVNFAAGAPRNRALAVYSALLGLGASLGFVLGGVLTAYTSWPWVFLVNLPVGVAAAVLAPRLIAETPRMPGRLDLAGTVTSALGMLALVLGLVRVASDGWGDALALLAFGLAAALLVAFVLVQARAAQPIVPLRLFDGPRSLDFATQLLLAAAMFGMFYLLTQFLQDVLGYSPLQAGLAFLPFTAVMFLTVRTMPRLLGRFGPGPLVGAGALLVAAGAIWLSRVRPDGVYAAQVLGPLVVFGLGAGCAFMPLNASILATVPPEDSGAASGVLQTLQWTGGSVGVAGLVTVLGTAGGPGDIAGGIGAALLGAGLFATGALALAAARPWLARRD